MINLNHPQSSNITLQDLPKFAQDIAKAILTTSKGAPFVLWLRGELGAGKTTFAGHLLHALGLQDSVPVLSPTFTYLTEYETPVGRIAHMDLYRLVENDLDSVQGLLDGREYSGIIVEWPERASQSPYIKKTHEIVLTIDNYQSRAIKFSAHE